MNELMWAAGFFDGEGWVTKNQGRPKPTLVIGVGQSGTTEQLERFVAAIGVGNIRGPYKHTLPNRKDKYQVSISGKKAHAVMEVLAPLICSPKREKYEALRLVVV